MTNGKKDILLALTAMFFFIGGIFLFIYLLTNVDEDLSDLNKREAIYKNFENEFNSINLPPKTMINKFERKGKHLNSILLTTRYRTEIEKGEFFDKFNQELISKGWILYQTDNLSGFKSYSYCRGKFDATLYSENGQKIWADGVDHWQLSFSLGLRTIVIGNSLPDKCLN